MSTGETLMTLRKRVFFQQREAFFAAMFDLSAYLQLRIFFALSEILTPGERAQTHFHGRFIRLTRNARLFQLHDRSINGMSGDTA